MQPEWSKMDVKNGRSETKRKVSSKPSRRNKTMDYVNSEGRLVNTKAYAIAWGVINKPYSAHELYIKCRDDKDAPSYRFIVQKCWQGYPRYYEALLRAGMEPRPPRTDMEKRRILGKASRDGFRNGLLDADYDVARMAAKYGVSSRESYERMRRENPESRVFLPPSKTIIRRFGTWGRFKYEVLKCNVDATLTEYVERSAEAGHWLRMRECDKLKIPIRGIMDLLRPTLFNALCYRKLALLGKTDSIKKEK